MNESDDRPEYADPERYAELTGFAGAWRDLFWNADFLELMGRRLELDRVRTILDVGSGAGHWGRTVLPLAAPDAVLEGVDHEPAFVRLATDAAVERNLDARVRYVEGEATNLPWPEDSFDLVTCQTLLIHVPDAAAVLREMLRVTRPGGLVLTVEPDNRAGNLALLKAEPGSSEAALGTLVRLGMTCEAGKRRLGEGDDSIGGLVAGLMRIAGMIDVRAWTNDRCIPLFPPYDTPEMQASVQQELAWAAQDVAVFTGSRHDTKRRFIAGGGSEQEFDGVWQVTVDWLRRFEAQVRNGTYHAARGFVLYLSAGRKPRPAR